jgi:type I restriction enzyme S subunit
MANGWTDTTLGELCDRGQARIQTGPFGSQLHSYDYQPTGVPVVPTEGIGRRRLRDEDIPRVSEEVANRLSRHKLKAGDILFARRGAQATGLSALVEARHAGWLCGTGAILLRLEAPDVDATFLSFVLSSDVAISWLKAHAVGAVMPNLNEGVLRRLPLRLPTPAEQRTIASVLGALDDKIELNRRMNETLEALARALFQNWFVDATQAGLPKGWRESTVDEDFNLTMGQSPPGESYNETGDGIPFYQGRTDFGFRYPTARVFCTAPTRFANAGDTLVSVRAPVGSVNMAAEKCSVGRGVASVRHKSGSRSYTYYFMRSIESDFAKFEADGTVFGSINKADFHAIKRAAPPPEIVEAFEKLLFPIDQRIENNENESRTLAALRDALLPKLLSGELRLPSQGFGTAGVPVSTTSSPSSSTATTGASRV